MRYIILLLLAGGLCAPATACDWAIKTIALEAAGESFEGQVAVASVIKTRMHKRKQTAKQVVLAPKQFSCWKPDHTPHRKRPLTQGEIDTATRAWEAGQVWQYDHYAHYKVENYWTKTAIDRLQLGRHVFYEL